MKHSLRGQAVAQESTPRAQDLQQSVEHLESEVKELRATLRQMQTRDQILIYVIQRLWQNAAPDHSSAPTQVEGGAAYARYQLTPKVALAGRAEYLSDRGGLFSGITQALKENAVTLDYALDDGFLMRYEWRRDFSNQASFLTDLQGILSKQQEAATVGLIWWWGRKECSW